MRVTRRLGAALLGLIAVPGPAGAWGYEGRRIVAAIARGYLTPGVRGKVEALLAADADATAAHDMASAATWADAWRNGHRETAQWHFVDLELGRPDLDAACFGHPASAVPASDGPERACIVDRLTAFLGELKDPATPQAERIVALKYVLHFVGDVHQPLHAADNQDHGGNCVRLALGGARTSNLHSLWDTGLVTPLGSDPVAVAETLRAEIGPAERAAWSKGDAAAWAMESYGVAKTVVYWPGAPAGCAPDAAPVSLPEGYEARAAAAVRRQLEKAGVRLAWVLNGVFG